MKHASCGVGYALYKRRVALGLSQKEMAERAGLSVPYYSTLERNQHEISFRTAAKLRKFCGLDLNELAEEMEWEAIESL